MTSESLNRGLPSRSPFGSHKLAPPAGSERGMVVEWGGNTLPVGLGGTPAFHFFNLLKFGRWAKTYYCYHHGFQPACNMASHHREVHLEASCHVPTVSDLHSACHVPQKCETLLDPRTESMAIPLPCEFCSSDFVRWFTFSFTPHPSRSRRI